VIGAMNLLNWVGIFLAAGTYGLLTRLITCWMRPMGPVRLHRRDDAAGALFYSPRETPKP